jgi:hypothetical protein
VSARAKYTPGPWMAAAGPSSVVGWPVVASPDGRSICNLSWQPKPSNVDEDTYVAFYTEVQANSHLIEAAPDMLEALRPFADARANSGSSLTVAHFDRAAAALAKAEGR